MTGQGGTRHGHGSVSPPVAVAFASVAFVALTICALGITSLVTGEDVIATPGLGQVPGIAGMICATLAFAGGLWAAIGRRAREPDAPPTGATPPVGADRAQQVAPGAGYRHPSYGGAVWTAIACFLAYIVAVWFGALFSGADLAVATAVAGRLATSWFGLVVAAAGFVCAWAGVALVRTRAERPRWPWEDPDDE